MINPENQYVIEIAEQLRKENIFSSEELSLIEDYLCGNVGDVALEKSGYHDLSQMAEPEVIGKLYESMLGKGMSDEVKRLEALLFAMGEASCYKIFSSMAYRLHDGKISLEPAKKAAIHAALIGEEQNRIRKLYFENLIANGENCPEHLKKAMEYRAGAEANGTLVLLTAYFYLKYPKVEKGMVLEGEDAALMERYEDLVVGSIPKVYSGHLKDQDADKIMEAMRTMDIMAQARPARSILDLAGSAENIDRFWLCILSCAAFVNHGLSLKLKNTVSICLAASWEAALSYIEMMDLRNDLMGEVGGSFDAIFHICSKDYIQWAARNRKVRILEQQFVRNRKIFLEYMNAAERWVYHVMLPIARKMAPELFPDPKVEKKQRQQSQLIDVFASKTTMTVSPGNKCTAEGDVRKYLSGEGGIEHVYACKDILKKCYYYWPTKAIEALKNYRQEYGYDALGNRCDTLLLASNGYLPVRDFACPGFRKPDEKEVKRVFSTADAEGLNLATQLESYSYLIDYVRYNTEWATALEHVAKEIFGEYFAERREEMLSAFQETGNVGRNLGLSIMAEHVEENKEAILGFSRDSAKAVKEALLELLYRQKGWEDDIVSMLSSKKAAERDTAIRVLAKWMEEAGKEGAETAGGQERSSSEREKYIRILSQALEKEKNGKIRALLEGVLHMGAESSEGGKVVTREELVREIHKGNKKRTLAWAYGTPFSKVHKKDGTEAAEEYLQAIFLCYSTMSPWGVSQNAVFLAKDLNEKELAVYANELYDKWMEAGAEAKKRWVLYAAAIHGGGDIVEKLHRQIQEWPKEARGAIASEAVRALALSPNPRGLLIVDGISRKFKFKQVKAAAAKALEFAASQLGITAEELADKIVPDLGFDENMRREFDYGERKFIVSITTALEIEVFDENGKKLKNLPTPGKKDDEAKAAAAYEEFKQMKKQIKATVSGQKTRLETALSTGRQWSVGAWKDLFVKNPIMHQFAIGLIWGVYEGKKLVSCFRYMEDGTFNTEAEEEFTLPEDTLPKDGPSGQPSGQGQLIDQGQFIALVHPTELSSDSLKIWKAQLDDYEIIQPIEQLDRQVYYRTEEEENQKELERFGGVIVNDLSLNGKLLNQGWYRGPAEDGGIFSTYYREDKELDLSVVLYFSGSYAGGANEDVTVYEIRFFKAGSLLAKSCCLSEVPERYFSEIVLQIAKATSASKEKNVNWKKGR